MKREETKEIYVDKDILVINKDADSLVIPERWETDTESLSESLKEKYGKVWVVHRLDRDTSGVLVFARNETTHRSLSDSFETRSVKKMYLALVAGKPGWEEMDCDAKLMPDGDRAHRTLVSKTHGKPSRTVFKVVANWDRYTLLACYPEGGRTHQIRVHAAFVGHPLICDSVYGDGAPVKLSDFKRSFKGDLYDERPLLERQALHAYYLKIENSSFPVSEFTAPLPKDLSALFKQLGKNYRKEIDAEILDTFIPKS